MDKNDSQVEVVETENNDTETGESGATETPVKKEETPAEKVKRLKDQQAAIQRQLKRAAQKAGIELEEIDQQITQPNVKQFSLDKSDKAYLIANGIKGKDEYELVTDFARNTGKDIEEIVDSKYFQSELTSLRQTRESKMASDVASGSPRATNSPSDTVEYWLAKDKLPPSYMVKLRREVVNAKIAKHKDASPFN